MDIDNLYDNVKRKYGFSMVLKDRQRQIIDSILEGKDTIGFLPTGYGKSLCYVLPPLLLDQACQETKHHVALVITSLISIMKDQTKYLRTRGVKAAFITDPTQMTNDDIKDIENGEPSIVFVSPESALSSRWLDRFKGPSWQSKICVLVVDESHCISEWGEDFRPEFKDLHVLRTVFNEVPVLSLTATVTEKIMRDIKETLLIPEGATCVAVKPDRPNIFLELVTCKGRAMDNLQWVVDAIKKDGYETDKIVIYCRTIAAVSVLGLQICDGLPVEICDAVNTFHGEREDDAKDKILEEFKKTDSKIRCVVATVAFGMGVDIPDIETIVHWGAPKSLICYWQEVGRCGRDGRQSRAIMYINSRGGYNPLHHSVCIREFTKGSGCLRFRALKYFHVAEMGDLATPDHNSINCACSCCCGVCKDSCPLV